MARTALKLKKFHFNKPITATNIKAQDITVAGKLLIPNGADSPETQTTKSAYTTKTTSSNVVDNSFTAVEEVRGDTVTSKNLFNNDISKLDEITFLNTSGVMYYYYGYRLNLAPGTYSASIYATNTLYVYGWIIDKNNVTKTRINLLTGNTITNQTFTLEEGDCVAIYAGRNNGSERPSNFEEQFKSTAVNTFSKSQIQVEKGSSVTSFIPYFSGLKNSVFRGILSSNNSSIEPKENLYKFSNPIELGKWDCIYPTKNELHRQTGYVSSDNGFTQEEIDGYLDAIVSADGLSLSYCLDAPQIETVVDIPLGYYAYPNGKETIFNDTSADGTTITITQTYSIHENAQEAATKAYVQNGLAKKLDKTGGTITGTLTVEGNSDSTLSALVVKNNEATYGLTYEGDAFKLGIGTVDENNEFVFDENEGLPIALRDNSTEFADGTLVQWNAQGNKLSSTDLNVNDIPRREDFDSYIKEVDDSITLLGTTFTRDELATLKILINNDLSKGTY